jgi:hypothetical protein
MKNSISLLWMISTVFGLLVTGWLSSCQTVKASAEGEKEKKTEVLSLRIDPEYAAPDRLDFTIDSASVKNNILSLYVKYYGGCKEHDFQMVATNYIKKSLPPQTELFMVHDPKNDTCYRPLQKVVNFSLEKLSVNEFEDIILDVNHQVYINYQPNNQTKTNQSQTKKK